MGECEGLVAKVRSKTLLFVILYHISKYTRSAAAQETAEVMNKQRRERRYLSYLLRLWQTRSGEKQVGRASLESPGTGERQGFASLEALFDFLHTQAEPQNEQGVRR
jgi:hypothetical protein